MSTAHTEAKAEILARIRGALHDAPAPAPAARTYRRTSGRAGAEVIEMLEDRLVDYKAGVHRETPESLPGRIAELLGASARYVVPAGIDTAWLPEETAARLRDRTAALLTALRTVQRLGALAAVGQLVAARRAEDGGWEFVVVRHGRLAAAAGAAGGLFLEVEGLGAGSLGEAEQREQRAAGGQRIFEGGHRGNPCTRTDTENSETRVSARGSRSGCGRRA